MTTAAPARPGPRLPDRLTVIGIALAAYAVSNVLHEAVGHGGACVALGGSPLALSSVHFECDESAMSALAVRGVSAAGTIVNFVAGLTTLLRHFEGPAEAAELDRRDAGVAVGVVASLLFVVVLGPSVRFGE